MTERVDSSVEYEKSNVVPCCRRCNTMKMNLTVEEFKKHIEKIYKKSIGVTCDRSIR